MLETTFCAALAKAGVDNQSSPDCDSQRDSAIPQWTSLINRDGVRATLLRAVVKLPEREIR